MRPTDATTRLLETLRRGLALDPTAPRAVAYSGGRDSATLLWGLARVCDPGSLTALHVDHGWRSATEREKEGQLVKEWCLALGVPLVSFVAPTIPPSNEVEARRHRYRCFSQWTGNNPGGLIYLAHHADDQAETILMRLLKGRSWDGLAGIPARRGPFRRPLLGIRASLLHRVAVQQNIPWHQDSTNLASGPSRNFLRNEVFPLLDRRWPRAVEALTEFGALWRDARPGRKLHPAWVRDDQGARVAVEVWDGWTPWERQEQLLSLTIVRPGPVSRRFLEAICVDGRRGPARGQGWYWERGAEVSWRTIAPSPLKEYFIVARPDHWYDLGSVRMTWSLEGPEGLGIPAIDGQRPWVWRSATLGLKLGSVDEPEWSRERRRQHLGGRPAGGTALVVQDGLVRAVVDVVDRSLVWAEDMDKTRAEKLHKGGIFVTLVTVTRNLTE